MANIPFKSIKFPGLDDAYTIPQIDSGLNTAGKAADAKATGDAISEINESLGDLEDLETTDKSSIVAAINEAAQTGGGGGTITVESILPKLYITGDTSKMTAEKNEVKGFSYVFLDENNRVQKSGYCTMKWQGSSSLSYPKKNYTIKFCYDAPCNRKEKVDFVPLGIKKNKYVTKANWVDRSMARNIINCRLWGKMVKSRHKAVPDLLANAPNWGAVNGYPILMYINGQYDGLYTFNIPKDADFVGMDEDNPLHCLICGDNNNNNNQNAAAFRTTTIGTSWEIEVPDEWQTYEEEVEGQTVTRSVKDNLSSTIGFVINSTDAEFVEHLDEHIDVESAIDYYLLVYLNAGLDNLARNMVMLTYDGGNKWYVSAYDQDTTWGNGANGTAAYNPTRECPETYMCTYSLLWERMEECFGNALWDRWCELKTTVLSPDYIKREFDLFWSAIPDDEFDDDADRWRGVDSTWPAIPQETIDFKRAIKSFIDTRWTYVDGCIRAMREAVPCTGITLSESSISFASGDPITLTATVTPENTTDDIVWSTSDASIATVVDGVVHPIGNGTCTITATCGQQSATCSVTVSALAYSVTLSGSGATLSPTTSVSPGQPYNGTITADTGYAIDSVTVTMGGTDITSSAYSSGTISIASVTGNIVVTVATSVYIDPTGLLYNLPSAVTFDGTQAIDTGVRYDGSTSLTIFIDAENPQDMATTQYLCGAQANTLSRAAFRPTTRQFNPTLNGGSVQTGASATPGARFKSVFRFNLDTGVQSVRTSVNGSETTSSYSINTSGIQLPRDAWTSNLYIGCLYSNGTPTNPMLTGKLHSFKVWSRRLTDSEVQALTGLNSLSDVITADKDASSTTYTVTLSGSGATLSPTSSVISGSSYTGTLAADSGYTIDSVTVTMGGTDITSTAYSSGTISIASVTGNIVVTVVTSQDSGPVIDPTDLEYALPTAFTMDGTSYIDTGFVYDATDDLTIALDLTQPTDMSTSGRFILGAKRSGTYTAVWDASYRGFKGIHNKNLTSGLPATAGQRVKAVLRYNSSTGVISIRGTCPDSVTGNIVEKTTANSHSTVTTANPTRDAFVNSMYIGGLHGTNGLESATESGTLHDVRIYTRRWTDAEVASWLGVNSLSTVFTDDMDA